MSRLLLLEQAVGWPFRAVFSDIQPIYNVHRDSVGADDVIMFGGGTDIDPTLYGETKNKYVQDTDKERDRIEGLIFNMFKYNVKGFIGICRGSQYLTVLSGGKLVQDIGMNHGKYHNMVDTRTGEVIYISSTHHQMMMPFGMDKAKYAIIAKSNERLSSFYDGEPGHRYTDAEIPCEPEVVWYPETKALCIQGHPEYMNHNHRFVTYSCQLVKEFLLHE
jgi:gamma-glutamyl-gamma-aminobutyrate hydrolase PuuD